jgi:nucleotide-binding universal stress UspA family protein
MNIVLNRILVPTDLSDGSWVALRYGVALAGEFGGALHVLHVLDAIPGVDPLNPELLLTRIEVERKAEAIVWDALDRVLGPEAERLYRPVLALEWGTPAVEITRYAKRHAIDMIAISCSRNGHHIGHVLGEVMTDVVRDAPCPVLALHQPERDFVLP